MIKLYQKRILIIDDNIEIHHDIRKVLEVDEKKSLLDITQSHLFDEKLKIKQDIKPDFLIDSVYQGKDALPLVHQSIKDYKPYALAFVDIRMPPGLNGVDTVKKIWKIDPDIQIVICTAFSDYSWSEMCREFRYSDNFLILKKPFDIIEIRQLAFALTKKWQLNRQNQVYTDNLEYLLKARSDELKKSEQMRLYETTHDVLTGLPNKTLLLNLLSQSLANAKIQKEMVGVYFIEVADIQRISEYFGFKTGDKIIKQFSLCLSKNIDLKTVTLARWESNVFVMVRNANSIDELTLFGNKLLNLLSSTCHIDNHEFKIKLNIGISFFPNQTKDVHCLLKYAAEALEISKQIGNNTIEIFQQEFEAKTANRYQIEKAIYQAIEENTFKLLYWPIHEVNSNHVTGVEISVLLLQPEKGYITSDSYLPIAKELGLLRQLEIEKIRHILLAVGKWDPDVLKSIQVSLKIESDFFQSHDVVDILNDLFYECHIDPNIINIEIEEISVLNTKSDIKQKMIELTNLGVHFILKDFVKDEVNLHTLSNLPIEKLKINIGFLQNLGEGADKAMYVGVIMAIARNLNLSVTAYGIETYSQINFLLDSVKDSITHYILKNPTNGQLCYKLLKKNNPAEVTRAKSTDKEKKT